MINVIKIGKQDYSFKFGMRVFWYVSNSGEIEFDEIDGKINADYDAFLQMFILANKSAKDGEELSLDVLEDAIDENPQLMIELQNAFANSKVIKKLQEPTEKKPKG